MQRSQRGVAALCLMAFLQGMVFYAPVAALYRTQAGISLGQIALIESISWLVVLALEVPWGLFTARVGYRASGPGVLWHRRRVLRGPGAGARPA